MTKVDTRNQPGTSHDGPGAESESAATAAADNDTRDPSLVAQVSASHLDFVLRSIGRQVTDTKLSVVEFSERSDGTAIAFVEADGGDSADFEKGLTDAVGIVQWESISEGESQRLYCVHLDGLEPYLRGSCTDVNVHVSRMTATEDGWSLNLRLPDREALTELAAMWREAGISFQLKRIAQTSSGNRTGHLAGLTTEQYELLWTAHESGYFEVPREASQTDLAEDLGVSTSGFSQRIRRGLGALLDSVFEGEQSTPPGALQTTGR